MPWQGPPLIGAGEEVPDRRGLPMSDHMHMTISIPPKSSVAQVVGYVTGKSAIHIAREFAERKRNNRGQNFKARGPLCRRMVAMKR